MTPRFLLVGLLVAAVAALGYEAPASPSPAPSPVKARPSRGGLDRALLGALRRAAAAAAYEGVDIRITSGRRSPEHQQQLLDEAISTYGSEAEARRWVATPETSPHVSGDAVDVGPSGAVTWLSARGAEYGLCQIYGNEPWHYELRPEAADQGCPPLYPDPTHDPRMQP